MATIKHIAARAGVSATTVSNVLHGRTNKVSPEKLQRIQEIILEEQYTPNMGAIILAHKISRIIGVIMFMEPRRNETVIEDPFSSTLLGAIEEEIRKHGYYLMLHTTSDESEIIKLARTWELDGLILVWVPKNITSIIQKSIHRPVVFIDSFFNDDELIYYNVGLDDFAGGYLVGTCLLNAGHTTIAFVANDATVGGSDSVRFAGLIRAYQEAGVTIPASWYNALSKDKEERQAMYNAILKRIPSVSAIAFSSDYYAIEAMNYFQDKGVSIPNYLSITGFDDNIFARIARPRLTTVHQNVYLKGKVAIELLIKLASGVFPEPHNIQLPVRLIFRESVAPKKNGAPPF